MMRPYRVTVVKHGRRWRFNAIAKSWYQCWLTAVDEFGIAAVITVKPV
jgi:hypothetical protein